MSLCVISKNLKKEEAMARDWAASAIEKKRGGGGVNAPSADVKKEWSCTSDPPVCLHGVQKENFTFTCSTGVHNLRAPGRRGY